MGNGSVLRRAIAAAVLSATIAAPAAVALTTATATARPIESPNCRAIGQARDDALNLANMAAAQGDIKMEREYTKLFVRASRNYERHCL